MAKNEFRFQVDAGVVEHVIRDGTGWKIKLTGECSSFHTDFCVLDATVVLGVAEAIPYCVTAGCGLVCPLVIIARESEAEGEKAA